MDPLEATNYSNTITENGMNKIMNDNPVVLEQKFLKYLLLSLHTLRDNERIVIGLSGWNSPKVFYGTLRDHYSDIEEDIREKIYFSFLDERVVDFEDDDSNYKLVRQVLLDDLVERWLLESEHILLPDFSLAHSESDYFHKVGKIDIWLIGVWEDGHICSLFPGHRLLDDTSLGYLRIDDSPKSPPKRITVSKMMIQYMQTAFIFFMGAWKKQALDSFLDEYKDYKTCPAKLVLSAGEVTLLSDIC